MEEALREACEAALPRPKRPSAFHLVQELPLGPTGKVARHRLRVYSGRDGLITSPPQTLRLASSGL
jgi:acyl-CoA synthetase (AMP-forming)/AMP-acid ligase II